MTEKYVLVLLPKYEYHLEYFDLRMKELIRSRLACNGFEGNVVNKSRNYLFNILYDQHLLFDSRNLEKAKLIIDEMKLRPMGFTELEGSGVYSLDEKEINRTIDERATSRLNAFSFD